jgi:hypothetical protein
MKTHVIKKMKKNRKKFFVQLKQQSYKYLKYFLFIQVLLLVINCREKAREIRYYPDETLFTSKDAEIIRLDTIKLNFKQITNKVGTYYNRYGKLVLEFEDKNIKKRVIPFVFDGGYIKNRNILTITSDSILKDSNYDISKLKRILRKCYTNKGKNFNYPETPYRNLVLMSIDTNMSSKDLKHELIRLTRTFDEVKNELNDTIKLIVYFDYSRQIKLPPPPVMRNEH